MGCLAFIFRNGSADASARGISRYNNQVVIVNAEGSFDPDSEAPGVFIVPHPMGDQFRPIAVPAKDGKAQMGGMWGGTFIYSSDGRFPCIVEGSKSPVPIPLHDRFEGNV